MSNTYNVKTSNRAILTSILERRRYALSENIILHGRGAKNYHLDRNQNLVYLLENFAGSPKPANPLDGQLWWDIQEETLKIANLYGSPVSTGSPWQTVVPPGQGVGFIVGAGQGLTYQPERGSPPVQAEKPTGSPLTIELKVNAGTGITLTANTVSIDVTTVDHDSLAGFVTNEHVPHSNVILTGNGVLISGATSADLTTSRTIDVSNGDGLTATNDEVNVNSTVVRTSGNQFIDGIKTFTQPILGPKGLTSAPSYSFYGDTDTGIWHFGGAGGSPSILGFATGGNTRFRIDSRGVLRSTNPTAAYETLVTEDDDIPNKKYVDDAAAAAGGGSVTQNTFFGQAFGGLCSISGLTSGTRYLVSVYGITRNNGTGSGTFGGIRITSVASSPPTSGLLYQGPLLSADWPDGKVPQHSMAVITAPAGGIIYGYVDYRYNTPPAIEWENARYMTAVQID